MAKEKSGKFLSGSAYNQTGTEDSPEQKDPYFAWSEVLDHHLSAEGADLTGSVNSRSGDDIMGGPCPGEPMYPPKK